MWSPLLQMLNSAKKFAAWPDEVSIAAAPPSISQIFRGDGVVGWILQSSVEVSGFG